MKAQLSETEGSTRAPQSVGGKKKVLSIGGKINALHEKLGQELRLSEVQVWGPILEPTLLLEQNMGAHPPTGKLWRIWQSRVCELLPLEQVNMVARTLSGHDAALHIDTLETSAQVKAAVSEIQEMHRQALVLEHRDSSVSVVSLEQRVPASSREVNEALECRYGQQSLVASSAASLWPCLDADPWSYPVPEGYTERLGRALGWLQSYGATDTLLAREKTLEILLKAYDSYVLVLATWDSLPTGWWTVDHEFLPLNASIPNLPVYAESEAARIAEQWDVYSVLLVALNQRLGNAILDLEQREEHFF